MTQDTPLQEVDTQVDPKLLTSLVPIRALGPSGLLEVLNNTVIERLSPGKRLFEQGDTDNDCLYLLSGEVELSATDGTRHLVVGGGEGATYPLANLKPRRFSGTSVTCVTIARVDADLLDKLLGWDQVIQGEVSGYEVTELGDDVDSSWMTLLMNKKIFRRLPTVNLQSLFERIQKVPVKEGDVVIKQGDEGDYYYIILEGRCLVGRKSVEVTNTVVLAALGEGDSFGEEALISRAPRNATVTMLSDGVLLRLAKKDFIELLEEPLLKRVSPKEASAKVKAGAVLLDVRVEAEYANGTLKRAVNLPLYLLRLRAKALDPGRPYVVFCNTGARSAAAAFLLSERGFDVYVLDGGLGRYEKVLIKGNVHEA